MQLVQKHLPKKGNFKLFAYLTLAILLISCKPFAYRQGIGFVFDYEVGFNRVQRAFNWCASHLPTSGTQVVLKRGDK